MLLKGYIEGYYGRLLSWKSREFLVQKLASLGHDFYIYAPKEDPYHRIKWFDLYPESEIKNFEKFLKLSTNEGIKTYFSVSPGLTFGKKKGSDFNTLTQKLSQLLEIGYENFGILLDDLNVEKSQNLGESHADLINGVSEFLKRSGDTSLIFCPTIYCNQFAKGDLANSSYLKGLSSVISSEFPLLWTGKQVVSDTISNEDIRELKSLFSNPVIVWDNYYANDYCPSRFFIGEYMGRSFTEEQAMGVGINPTGSPLTDAIILDQFDGKKEIKEIFSQNSIPKEFIKLYPFFEGPFSKELTYLDIQNSDAIKKLFETLCIEWKSDLQLEWAPYLWQLFMDINLFNSFNKRKDKKKLEEWVSRRYSSPLMGSLFFDRDKN